MSGIHRSLLLACLGAAVAGAQIANFKHLVVIFQENRTPNNLFQGLCAAPFGSSAGCSATPGPSQYNIRTRDWLDRHSATGVTQPTQVLLGNSYDLSHAHTAFVNQCDKDPLNDKRKATDPDDDGDDR